MCESWAWERNHGFDVEGYERKEACLAIAECPVCGQDIELVAETEEWVEGEDGRWHHSGWGPASAVCCNKLIADWWEGCFVYDLTDTPRST